MIINANKVGEYTKDKNDNTKKDLSNDTIQIKKIKQYINESNLVYVSENVRELLAIQKCNDLGFLSSTEHLSSENLSSNKLYRVCLYIRLSVEDGDLLEGDVSRSIKNQLLFLLDECKKREWVVVGIFCEEDISGVDDERPEWKKSLKFCEAGCTEIVLCKSQSRFTRSMEMVEKYLHTKFVEWNIRFVGLVDSTDTSVKGNKKARQINGLVYEWQVEDQSINTRETLKKMKVNGQYTGSFAPYGYKKDPKDKYHLVIDEPSAKVVRMIFELYKNGYGYYKICKTLNEKRILTPYQYKKNSGSKYICPNAEDNNKLYYLVEKGDTLESISNTYRISVKDIISVNQLTSTTIKENQLLVLLSKSQWTTDTIRNMLMDEVYIGTLVQGKKQGISYKKKKQISIPREQWIRVPHCHEPIIDQNTWLLVSERFNGRGKARSTKNGEICIFSKKIYCSSCGKVFVRNVYNTKSGKRAYLQCKRRRSSPGFTCSNRKAIQMHELEELILGEINKQLEEYYDLTKVKENYYQTNVYSKLEREVSALQEEEKEIEKAIAKKSSALSLIYEDRVEGIITVGEFSSLKAQYTNNISELQLRIENIKEEILLLKQKKNSQSNKEDLLKKYKKITKLDRVIINEFIDKIMIEEVDPVTKKRAIEIQWNY